MSKEEQPKITTVKKVKDPRRVEAGKRLALISKEARERKMRERIEKENEERREKVEKEEAREEGEESEGWNVNYGFLFGAIGAITAIGSLYYTRRSDEMRTRTLKRMEEPKESNVVIRKESEPSLDCL